VVTMIPNYTYTWPSCSWKDVLWGPCWRVSWRKIDFFRIQENL
jgi:hypothetical protein